MSDLSAYLLHRLGAMLLTVLMAATLAFIGVHLIAGDPVQAALSQATVPEEVLERRRAALGLDQPLPVQYVRYLANLAQGDLGISWSSGQEVGLLIAQQLPATISLAAAALIIAVTGGLVLGLGAAIGGDTWLADLIRVVADLLLAFPVMFSGMLLIWVFAITLDLLPATGQGGPAHLILPAFAIGLSVMGSIAGVVEAGTRAAMSQPFMLTAAAKGLSHRGAVVRHALRVGLLPTLDIIALQAGYLLGGTVVTESVFARQGLGRLMLSAVLDKDLPVVAGGVILSALIYSVLNLAADLAHAAADPRVRLDAA